MSTRLPILAILVVVFLTGCGDDASPATTTSLPPATTTTLPPATTTTLPPTTTTTLPPTTTTLPPTTTTTEPDYSDAWVSGSTVLRVGDCFIDAPQAGGGSQFEAAPCDTPHLGEIVGAGSACPEDVELPEIVTLASDYTGVEGSPFEWASGLSIDGQQIKVSASRMYGSGPVQTMCYILAVEGDLNRSYRATSG